MSYFTGLPEWRTMENQPDKNIVIVDHNNSRANNKFQQVPAKRYR